jgi:hypothetical protein
MLKNIYNKFDSFNFFNNFNMDKIEFWKKGFKVPFIFILLILYLILVYIFYKYKKVYQFVFQNPLGYLFVIFLIGFSYYLNKNIGILIGFGIGLLYILSGFLNVNLFNTNVKVKEGFTWDQNTIQQFSSFQQTVNPNLIFDLSAIQQQVSQSEAEVLLNKGMWPWQEWVQQAFINNVQNNTILKTSPENAMNRARTIYNQQSIKELLSWQEPEGQFLLNGIFIDSSLNYAGDSGMGTYGVNSGLVSENKDIIRCGMDPSGQWVLKRIHNLGNDGITGAHKNIITDVSYSDLPNLIPNFTYISGECNPCVALNSPPIYTCPFSLKGNPSGISYVWNNLWGINNSEPSLVLSEMKASPKEFPLLRELKRELKKYFVVSHLDASSNPITVDASFSTVS